MYMIRGPDGRYEFCRVRPDPGYLAAGDCNDAKMQLPVEVNGDTVLDIDLASWIAACQR